MADEPISGAAEACTVYLFEIGFPESMPGFKKNFPAASFPFWGNYYFLDFAITNFRTAGTVEFFILADNRYRSLISFVVSRWESETSRLLFLEGGLKQFIQLLENDSSDAVIISSLNLISIIEEDALGALCKNIKGNIVKLSLNNTPVDIYMADRRKLIKELESFLYRNHKMKKFEETLFQEILHTSFDIIEDIPGMLLFHNNLMQMYRENLWLVANNGSRDHAKILSRLEGVKISDKQTLIGSSSHVKDSIISSGAHIEGYVEGSIIFSDVVVRKGARVVNSIVMNNNRIGAQAQIHNCLIFPSLAESARSFSNIGEDALIGAKRSFARNEHYPEHIRDGLTVLGLSPEIPSGYRIEPGCFVGPEVPFQHLRNRKQMKKGSTILCNTVR